MTSTNLCKNGRFSFLASLWFHMLIVMLFGASSYSALTEYDRRGEHTQIVSRDTSPFTAENFVRMGFQASIVAGQTLVIHGGDIHWRASQNKTQGDAMNSTLTIDLSQSWTPGNVTVNVLESEAPSNLMALLWLDNENSVYSFGGEQSQFAKPNTSSDTGAQLWKFSGSKWTEVSTSPSISSPSLTGISPTQGGGASGGSVGYALGGYTASGSQGPVHFTGLLSYNITSNMWFNDSTAPAITPYGLDSNKMIFMSGYGAEGVLIAIGGTYAGIGSSGSPDYVPFSNISVYDIASKSWFWQTATGITGPEDIPAGTSLFCMIGTESAQGTHEIFVYGGGSASNLIYILSLPGFVWLRANDSSTEPRIEHSCNTLGNRQIVSIGGRNPTLNINQAFDTKDSFPQGLGVFDMADLKWTHSYNASAAPYTLSALIQEWYNGPTSNSSVQWASTGVRSLFFPNSTKVDVSTFSGTSSASGLSGGAIAGIVVGSMAFVAAVTITIWLVLRRRQRRRQRQQRAAVQGPTELPTEEKKRIKSHVRHELGSFGVDADGSGHTPGSELQPTTRAELFGSSVPELPAER